MSEESDAPDEIDLALPFYATGHATPADKLAVEAALRDGRGDIAGRLERVREEMQATRLVSEASGDPSPRVAERLFAQIDRVAPVHARKPGGTATIAARIAAWMASASPRVIGWSAAAAAALILIETGLVGGLWLGRPASSTFKTASFQSDTASSGSFALVGFVPNTPIAQIGTLLQQHGMTIVDGPKPGGFYRVRLAATTLTPAAMTEALTALRSETGVVRFVAPEP